MGKDVRAGLADGASSPGGVEPLYALVDICIEAEMKYSSRSLVRLRHSENIGPCSRYEQPTRRSNQSPSATSAVTRSQA